MNLFKTIELAVSSFADFMWSAPFLTLGTVDIPFLLFLLLGGGVFFSIYSRFVPFKYFSHGVKILMGKYNDPNDPGEITHFQALTSALASTVGLGNISGVAIAIQMGGARCIILDVGKCIAWNVDKIFFMYIINIV